MYSYASEKQKRSAASSPVSESVDSNGAASFTTSIFRTALAAFCCSLFAIGPAHGQSDGTGAQPATVQQAASPITLDSGTYQGIWRDENGRSGPTTIVIDVKGDSFTGELAVDGVQKYSGDRIRGKIETDDDGAVSVEFKTRDGMWKSKATYDGQLLIGSYYYEYQQKRVQKLVKGEWAAQKVPDTT